MGGNEELERRTCGGIDWTLARAVRRREGGGGGGLGSFVG